MGCYGDRECRELFEKSFVSQSDLTPEVSEWLLFLCMTACCCCPSLVVTQCVISLNPTSSSPDPLNNEGCDRFCVTAECLFVHRSRGKRGCIVLGEWSYPVDDVVYHPPLWS